MSQSAGHCPFLNRRDARCARHLRLDHLGHMMRYCADRYDECGTYVGLLLERQVRRDLASAAEEIHESPPVLQITIGATTAPRRHRAATVVG